MHTKFWSAVNVTEDEMGHACSTYGKHEKCIHCVGKLEGLGLYGRVILKWVLNIVRGFWFHSNGSGERPGSELG